MGVVHFPNKKFYYFCSLGRRYVSGSFLGVELLGRRRTGEGLLVGWNLIGTSSETHLKLIVTPSMFFSDAIVARARKKKRAESADSAEESPPKKRVSKSAEYPPKKRVSKIPEKSPADPAESTRSQAVSQPRRLGAHELLATVAQTATSPLPLPNSTNPCSQIRHTRSKLWARIQKDRRIPRSPTRIYYYLLPLPENRLPPPSTNE